MPKKLDRWWAVSLAGCLFAASGSEPMPAAPEREGMAREVPIERQRMASTSIESVGYSSGAKVMEVRFRSGAVYRYFAVPQTVFEAFKKADSKGRFFTREVRGRYHFIRMEKSRP